MTGYNNRRPNVVESDEEQRHYAYGDDYSQLTTATRNHDYGEEDDGPCLIRVIAPATLQEGYTFDVLVDDEPYTVEVPPGGIEEGQEFEVEYNPDQQYKYQNYHGTSYRSTNNNKSMERLTEESNEGGFYEDDAEESGLKEAPTKTLSGEYDEEDAELSKAERGVDNEDESKAIWYDKNGAPIGRWRTRLCSCCDVLTQSTFWMGVLCTPILMAQLVDRLRLTWNGRPGPPEQTSLSYNRILLSLIFTLAFFWVPVLGWILIISFYAVVVIYVGSHVRGYMRQKYKIPARLPFRCGQYIDDAFFMTFFGCCSAIQMARHTHDDKDYPGHGCTTTGLGPDAPAIV
ncbi:PLAC8 family domain containing protein [Nitzschia inconspicua]|uniref:PLAC8 family domain containing protein n=1 Tax=Nitzschia inconspicua TaxID=303405 RepID=A0A9K3K5X5_9STRA|nr:PLAC8 family domain containing protein [Nitzschia inconspicua]KAG7374761.1 PLAC8 family domain containing protein [Nitzschia inconspicua]